MKRNYKLICLVAGLAWMIFSGNAVAAAVGVGPTLITRVRTGWLADTFIIETGQAIVNPAACTTADGYISDLSIPGYKTHYSAVLLAFSLSKKVTIIISDVECYAGRPKIMGIYIDA